MNNNNNNPCNEKGTCMLMDAAISGNRNVINPLNAALNPIRHLLALVGADHILHVSRIRVKKEVGKILKYKDLTI